MSSPTEVVIVGAGIGGLTLALELHDRGIGCQVLEAAPQLAPLGVGINLLPHATRALSRLGLLESLAEVAVTTRESVFYNRFGQLIVGQPAGRFAGYDWPQLSIHRGDLHRVLLDAVHDRLPADTVRLDHCVESVESGGDRATARVRHADGSASVVSGTAVVGADGVHSAVRRQLHGDEAGEHYTGCMMWRGTTVMPAFLTGASMVRAGWFTPGKLVIYPIRDNVDAAGNQLVNWVAEVAGPMRQPRDWSRAGRIEDFIAPFDDWVFDWLDVPRMLRGANEILEYPMIDQDPLPWWGNGRVTLLGDAAHPMVPRGSNGAAQAILDAGALADALRQPPPVESALAAYEAQRRPATARVVLTNRTHPPDAVLREVYERTGDRPFTSIDDVITADELRRITDSYAAVAGYSHDALRP